MSSFDASESTLPTPIHDTPFPHVPVDELAPRQFPRDRVWLHILLLLLAFVTTTLYGASFYESFATALGQRRIALTGTRVFTQGMWYSLTVLAILGAHEMGHYLACRYYRINASLPYFIPAVVLSPFGTLGAVIRIREPIRTKRMLFDIGVAGPIAGFVVLVPALFLAMYWSEVVRVPAHIAQGMYFGEPLLFKIAKRAFFGVIPEGYDVNLHPMGWAAWLGMLATALNLIPIGQLDGGHITYANLGRHANRVSYVGLAILLGLGIFVASSWLVWAGLLAVLMGMFGFQHPPTVDEHDPLGARRILISLFAVVMFALCFTPVPITFTP